MYIHIYIYRERQRERKILRGGIPMSIGSFPGKFESISLSRRNVSRRIGRSTTHARLALLIVKVVACVHANTYYVYIYIYISKQINMHRCMYMYIYIYIYMFISTLSA